MGENLIPQIDKIYKKVESIAKEDDNIEKTEHVERKKTELEKFYKEQGEKIQKTLELVKKDIEKIEIRLADMDHNERDAFLKLKSAFDDIDIDVGQSFGGREARTMSFDDSPHATTDEYREMWTQTNSFIKGNFEEEKNGAYKFRNQLLLINYFQACLAYTPNNNYLIQNIINEHKNLFEKNPNEFVKMVKLARDMNENPQDLIDFFIRKNFDLFLAHSEDIIKLGEEFSRHGYDTIQYYYSCEFKISTEEILFFKEIFEYANYSNIIMNLINIKDTFRNNLESFMKMAKGINKYVFYHFIDNLCKQDPAKIEEALNIFKDAKKADVFMKIINTMQEVNIEEVLKNMN